MDREKSYFIFVSEIVDALRGKRLDLHDARQALTVMNQIAAVVKVRIQAKLNEVEKRP